MPQARCPGPELISSSDTARAQPLTKRELRVIFSGLILAMILAALDQSIVNTALPRTARDPGGLAHLSWVVTAFMLSSTIATPIWGTLIGGGLNPAQAGFMLLSSIFGGRLSSDAGRPKLFMAGDIALEATGLSLLALLAVNQAGIP